MKPKEQSLKEKVQKLAKEVFQDKETAKLAEEYQRKYGRFTPRDNCFLRV